MNYIGTFREDIGQDAVMDTFDKFDDGVILYKIAQMVTSNRPLTASKNGSFLENLSSNRSVGGVMHGSVGESQSKFTSLNGKKKKRKFG